MAVVKNKTTEANREYWSHIEEVAKEVGKWPTWMGNRGKESNEKFEQAVPRSRAASASGADNK